MTTPHSDQQPLDQVSETAPIEDYDYPEDDGYYIESDEESMYGECGYHCDGECPSCKVGDFDIADEV